MGSSLTAKRRELTDAVAALHRVKLDMDLAEREESGEIPVEPWQTCHG